MPYLLDGSNLVGRARRGRGSDADREALVAEISERLRRTRATAVLFFDGSGGGREVVLGNLRVRDAAPASADDAIVAQVRAASSPGELIVVTADRTLARRVRDAGGKTLDPETFWERFGGVRAAPLVREEERVDVADWMRWFEQEKGRRS